MSEKKNIIIFGLRPDNLTLNKLPIIRELINNIHQEFNIFYCSKNIDEQSELFLKKYNIKFYPILRAKGQLLKYLIPGFELLRIRFLLSACDAKAILFYGGREAFYLIKMIKLNWKIKSKIIYFFDEFPWLVYGVNKSILEDSLQYCDAIIEMDNTRHKFLLKNLDILNGKKKFIIPNIDQTSLPRNHATLKGINYWRNYFGIPNSFKKIILYHGEIAYHSQIIEILVSTKNWTQDIALIVHGWSKENFIEKFGHVLNEKIFFNLQEEDFDLSHYYDLVQSVDFTIALYTRIYALDMIGKSSGKINFSIMAKTPVITNRYEGLLFIEEKGLGVLIDNVDELCKVTGIYNKTDFMDNLDKYQFETDMNELVDYLKN